jgi:hypothetical protein
MQNIVKNKISARIENNSFTNMRNSHTFTICGMNLISTDVVVMHGQAIKIARDVVGGATVCVPVVVDADARCSSCSSARLRNIVLLEAMPTVVGSMTDLQADLALRLGRAAAARATMREATTGRMATTASTSMTAIRGARATTTEVSTTARGS